MKKRALSILITLGLCVGMAGAASAAGLFTTQTLAGNSMQCAAVRTDGSLWVWDNAYTTSTGMRGPAKVMDGVVSVEGGGRAFYAITEDGGLLAWGKNNLGQLGDGTTTDRRAPVKIMDDVVYVSACNEYAAAIKTDGSLWVWGENGSQHLGVVYPLFLEAPDQALILTPIKVMDHVKNVNARGLRIDAVKEDGTLWTWGFNQYRGDGTGIISCWETPVQVMTDVKKVTGGDAVLALKEDGSVWGWGFNHWGQLGCGTREDDQLHAVKMLLDDVADIQGTALMTVALTKRGEAYVCGDFAPPDSAVPYQTAPWKLADNVAAVCDSGPSVLMEDGTVWEWNLGRDAGLLQVFDGVAMPSEIKADAPSAPAGSVFTDVPANMYYAKPVEWAVKNSITSGTSATTFSPEQKCTRGQIITFLYKTVDAPAVSAGAGNSFGDVSKNDYFYAPTLWAVASGVAAGKTFAPNEDCTRGAAMEFIWRSLGCPKPASQNNPFRDVSRSDSYYDAVLWAVGEGITGGTGAATFSPGQTCTRGQIMTFLYKTFA